MLPPLSAWQSPESQPDWILSQSSTYIFLLVLAQSHFTCYSSTNLPEPKLYVQYLLGNLFTPCVNFTQTFAHSILFGYFLHLVKSINILGNLFTHLQLRILLSGQFYPDLFLRPILYRVIFYILCDL